MLNKTIQSFTIQKKLGAGGMATVYLAENSIGKKAAIKVLHTKYFHDASVKDRFVQEAKVMARLHHPNICSVISMEETSEFAAIIMEFLEGQDLSDYVSSKGAVSEDQALAWLEQISKALDYAHSEGVIHRDIKPSNFFLTNKGHVKVMDFGIAKAQNSMISTHTNSRMGSIVYMSPEQIKSPKYVSHKTDIYSLGVTLHHLLAGKIPYDTTTQSEYTVMEKIIKESLPVLSCSDQLNQLIQIATQKDPKKRPDSLANWLALKDETSYKAPRKTPLPPEKEGTILRPHRGPDKGKTPQPHNKVSKTKALKTKNYDENQKTIIDNTEKKGQTKIKDNFESVKKKNKSIITKKSYWNSIFIKPSQIKWARILSFSFIILCLLQIIIIISPLIGVEEFNEYQTDNYQDFTNLDILYVVGIVLWLLYGLGFYMFSIRIKLWRKILILLILPLSWLLPFLGLINGTFFMLYILISPIYWVLFWVKHRNYKKLTQIS